MQPGSHARLLQLTLSLAILEHTTQHRHPYLPYTKPCSTTYSAAALALLPRLMSAWCSNTQPHTECIVQTGRPHCPTLHVCPPHLTTSSSPLPLTRPESRPCLCHSALCSHGMRGTEGERDLRPRCSPSSRGALFTAPPPPALLPCLVPPRDTRPPDDGPLLLPPSPPCCRPSVCPT